LFKQKYAVVAIALLAIVNIVSGTLAISSTTRLFQANEIHRAPDKLVRDSSTNVTRKESVNRIFADVEVSPTPVVRDQHHKPERASRSHRIVRDLYTRPHKIYRTSACPVGPAWVKTLAHAMAVDKFGESQWMYLDKLWTKESQFNPWCENSSGAYGVPQALPGSKMGKNWRFDVRQQIRWGLTYIQERYSSPSRAWRHSVRHNWY
jgi:hypothetical protein